MSLHGWGTGTTYLLGTIAITACVMLSECGYFDSGETSVVEADGINAALPETRFQYGPLGSSNFQLIVDTHTGVTYLFYHASNRVGITPLLNSDGTPVIDDRYSATEEVER